MNRNLPDPSLGRAVVILIVCVVFVAVLYGVCLVLLNQGSNDIARMAAA